jgi:hypothetical protein
MWFPAPEFGIHKSSDEQLRETQLRCQPNSE